jgi:uncharacterized ParB-like nuclease family protein
VAAALATITTTTATTTTTPPCPQAKVAALMASIQEIGLQEPIDVLLVEGRYYGFSGCHRCAEPTVLAQSQRHVLCRGRPCPGPRCGALGELAARRHSWDAGC